MLITSPTSLPTSSALSASSPFFGPASPAYPPSAPLFSPTSLQYVGPSDSPTAPRREQPRYSLPNPVSSSTQQFSTPWPDYSPTSPTFSTTATQFNAPPEDLSGTTGSYCPLLAVFDGTVWHFQHPGGLPVHEPLRNIPKRARFLRLNIDPRSRAFLEETMNEGAYAVWALAAVMEAGYGSETAANIWIVKTG